jgi:hypothetical protein
MKASWWEQVTSLRSKAVRHPDRATVNSRIRRIEYIANIIKMTTAARADQPLTGLFRRRATIHPVVQHQ